MRRLQLTLVILLLTAGLLQQSRIAVAGARTDSTCGYRTFKVSHFQKAELVTSCRALADVVAYFQNIGFNFKPTGSVTFRQNIIDVTGRIPIGATRGFYDERDSKIVMIRSAHSRPWGLRWSPELAASFLRHELVHLAIRRILGDDYRRLRPEWHEFIAYSVQFELMSPSLRNSILSGHSEIMEFASLAGINEFTSRMDPTIFSIACYKTYRKNGSEELVRRLLRFELRPPQTSYPFPVFPNQIPK